jgi:hypothetical protein
MVNRKTGIVNESNGAGERPSQSEVTPGTPPRSEGMVVQELESLEEGLRSRQFGEEFFFFDKGSRMHAPP